MSRTIKEAVDSVFAVARENTQLVWQQNLRRSLAKLAASGLAFSSGAVATAAKSHEHTIRETCAFVETQVRRVLDAYPNDQVVAAEPEIRSEFSTYLEQCFTAARKHLGKGERESTFARSFVDRATMGWRALRLEMTNNFEIMLMEAKKAGAPASTAGNVVYNIASGPGARVNINSADSSHNVVTVHNAAELFANLRRDVEAQVPEPERAAIHERIDRMEKAGNDKSAMLGAYSEWVRLVAAHASIIGAYVPAITQLIASIN